MSAKRANSRPSGPGPAPDAVPAATPEDAAGRVRAGRGRPWIIPLLFAAQLAVVGLYYVFAARYPVPAQLLVEDSWAVAGREGRIRVEIDRDLPPLIRSRLGDLEVDWVPGPRAGAVPAAASTDRRGVALAAWTAPAEPGIADVVARVALPGGESVEATASLFAFEPGREIVYVTVPRSFYFLSATDRRAVREFLNGLAKDHAIVYLDLLPRDDLDARRRWIEGESFPPGPVVVVERTDGESLGLAVRRQLDERAAAGSPPVRRVVTSSEDDLAALAGHVERLLFVFPRPGVGVAPASYEWARDWAAATRLVRG